MSVADSLKSECGVDFDEYVRRALEEPFPYNSMMPASRTIENLWSGRRFRLYNGPDVFREGKVVSWQQWNTGPLCRVTFWCVNVEMDSFGVGDSVLIGGLQSANQYNGKEGTIEKLLGEKHEGRYRIKLVDDDDNKTFIAVKPKNLNAAPTTYKVNRMNIEGGGTLKVYSENPNRLISLEWLEPASPAIDLDEGALMANCPTCRAVEPPLAAYDDAPMEKEQECPVCFEKKPCRTLQCDHGVCNGCWSQWRNKSSGIPVSPPEVDEDQLQKEQAASFQETNALLPHTYSGTGSKPGDSEAILEKAHKRFLMRMKEILDKLLEMADSGDGGLSQFWRELMTASIHVLVIDQPVEVLRENLPIPALEILIRVVEARKVEIMSCFKMLPGSPPDKVCEEQVQVSLVEFTNRIGELYEEVHNFRGAIPWYERCLMEAKKRLPINDQYAKGIQKTIATQHNNLALAQKNAGFLSKALLNYNASLQIVPSDDVRENRKTLRREMKQWTGSSGKLTPGC